MRSLPKLACFAAKSAYFHRPGLMFLTLALGLAACQSSPKRYPIAGQIMSIDLEKKRIVLSHGDIPGYMPAMVMPLNVKDERQLGALTRGDQIAATLAVDSRQSCLEDIRITRKG